MVHAILKRAGILCLLVPSLGWASGIFSVGSGSSVYPSTGIVSFPAGIQGIVTASSATAGTVGEYISSAASAVSSPGNLQYFDVTSITLTAGDWDVRTVCVSNGSTVDDFVSGIGTATGNSATGLTNGDTSVELSINAGTATNLAITIPSVQKNITSTTTYYLKARYEYASGSPTASGRISARRIR